MNLWIVKRVTANDVGDMVRAAEVLVRAHDEDDARALVADETEDESWLRGSSATCVLIGRAMMERGGPVLMVTW